MAKNQFIFKTSQNQRLDNFLRIQLPLAIKSETEISNSKIRRLIVSGQVFVNGKCVNRPAFELRGNSTVCVEFDEEKFFYEKQPDDIKFEVTDEAVLFEDENLIFINKPSGFPVEQTITGNRANLHDAVVAYLWKRNATLRNPPYVGIMHRLDKDTSGVILFTKNRPVNKPVQNMFATHEFTKEYLAVVTDKKGFLKVGKTFTVEKYMGRVSGKSTQGKWGSVSDKNGGQFSKTDFEVLEKLSLEGKSCFLIKCNLYTGRTHQIRVHLSEEGFPILGDEIYGGEGASRLYLHASRLAVCNSELSFDVSSKNPFLQ